MAFLELNKVSKGYGFGAKRAEVLHDINLHINEGEFVAIVGYSGAGKTTLMSLIAGLQHPDQGTATLRGETVTEPSPDRAIVFQNYSLLPWLSVYENIALAVDEVFSDWPADKRRAHVEKYIAMVNLTPARDKKPRELSGGMRQRVSVARALAMDPKILLMDEPLSALDALTRAVLQDEIARIWSESKKTVVLITNDVDEGIIVADRIIPLSAGPRATLGPSVQVDIERPRDRKALNHDPRFKTIRKEVISYLLGSGGQKKTSITRKLILPDIEPEDLNVPRGLVSGRISPVRRNEIKQETVEVE
ncbi:MAG TPA: ABC transporter ATP-binding protein [Verrucomicrobiota bacterium]|nr:ABC transporter ATP-binding protein [Verrucomicrobiota bacterium]